ncbi:hypothetical protein SS50377_25680 [Spironucleus salmonicida]|uniref:Uncharacterized protein n=1 Tax=Spironucleus salmonicida TaxID=348837 RepID=V6LEN6_9EUKA|nr:hypothetical protein SS50377_25680 [Spironucleus salmonicida]|eukprot:EST42718.1 Hypothetical protein SS50377_17741 [Spironucleus salmonicida]
MFACCRPLKKIDNEEDPNQNNTLTIYQVSKTASATPSPQQLSSPNINKLTPIKYTQQLRQTSFSKENDRISKISPKKPKQSIFGIISPPLRGSQLPPKIPKKQKTAEEEDILLYEMALLQTKIQKLQLKLQKLDMYQKKSDRLENMLQYKDQLIKEQQIVISDLEQQLLKNTQGELVLLNNELTLKNQLLTNECNGLLDDNDLLRESLKIQHEII